VVSAGWSTNTSLRHWGLARAVLRSPPTTQNDLASAQACGGCALAIVHWSEDVDLELCALSEVGTALVQAGNVANGAELFDESMAGAFGGEAHRLETAVFAARRV
jgi:hypothetical protein